MCLTAYRQMEMDTAAVVSAVATVAATHFQVAVQQGRREGRASRQCNASRPMPTGGRSRGWDRPQLARWRPLAAQEEGTGCGGGCPCTRAKGLIGLLRVHLMPKWK